jgi:hypothetical protein
MCDNTSFDNEIKEPRNEKQILGLNRVYNLTILWCQAVPICIQHLPLQFLPYSIDSAESMCLIRQLRSAHEKYDI